MKEISYFILSTLLIVFLSGCMKPDIAEYDIDLDTTYYPCGLGYEWSYKNHSWRRGNWPFDEYSTSFTKVTDSFWIEDTLIFEINFSEYIKFWEDRVNGKKLYPKPDSIPIPGGESWVIYVGDTLKIEEYYEAPEEWPPDIYESWEHRLKGVGLISSGGYWSGHGDYSEGSSTRLLYFYNGQDTVWP
ncbi:hypothetical protein ES703_79704 [subsurface metagenome]